MKTTATRVLCLGTSALLLAAPAFAAPAQAPHEPPLGNPLAIVDLGQEDSLARVSGVWRFHEANVKPIPGRGPGPDLKPSGAPITTLDIEPQASPADFDDRSWPVISPTTLAQRRGSGRVSFAWYRLTVTLPERLGDTELTGKPVALEVVVDDYAEIWVDGRLPLVAGQQGGNVVKGFGAPNRVMLTEAARPGQSFRVAIFAMNGPISGSPHNFIWLKSATLEVLPQASVATAVRARVTRRGPSAREVLPDGLVFEQIASGFQFTEGPVWHPDGYLLFSDPNANTLYRWDPSGVVFVYRTKSGYTGLDVGRYRQPGSNGLGLDGEGRLTIAEHGNRRITRIERNGVVTVLADRYEGKRLNSPNDLVYRSDGTLVFSDPPFGLPGAHDDPAQELGVYGVYCLRGGKLDRIDGELRGPNGVAFSPDERFLYVGNWDEERKVIMRYALDRDCRVQDRSVFVDLTLARGKEAIDGLEVDAQGNLFVSGPGGVWVLAPTGQVLAQIVLPELPANFAWGDADRRTLYMTARSGVYRVRLPIPGAGHPRDRMVESH